jgi:S-layer homology domain
MYYHCKNANNQSLSISKGSASLFMSQKKHSASYKSIILLSSFLSTAIISNVGTFAAQAATTQDPSVDLVEVQTAATEQVAQAIAQSAEQPATQAAPEQVSPVAPAAQGTAEDINKTGEKPTEAQPATEQAAPTAPTATDKVDDKSGSNSTTDKPAPTNRSAQANLSDISGHWAEPFISVLTQNGIIAGYPDGTFQPDRPVTRAEFAALVNKAFPDAPEVRAAINFRDVPRGFWAANAIRKATTTGFLVGYPDRTFQPKDNIKRIDSLVAFVNGAKITPEGQGNIDELFTDTNQVPAYGRDQLTAAAQRCVAVSSTYPDGKTFNPTGVATRADVAAFLHQTLVAAGRLPKLADDSPAQKYIVNCAPAPQVANISEQDILGRTGVPSAPAVQQGTVAAPVNAPVGGVTTPNAFGANWGDFFIGAGTQDRIPAIGRGVEGQDSTSLGVGFGLGDARNAVGLEASYSTAGSFNSRLFNRGNFNFKLHKIVADNLSVAVGWENAFSHGYTAANDPGSTVYGVVTGVLPLGETSNITASVGAGNGRFRHSADIETDRQSTNIFGSLGFRVSENFALVGDYNGRNLNVGLPITLKLSDGVGVQVTPALLDIGGNNFSGPSSRFAVSGGLGIKF